MIVYIHSHEMGDRGYTFGRHLEAVGGVIHIVVPSGTSITGINSLVQAQVSTLNSIDLLIFNGHGDLLRTGAIFFGTWIDDTNAHQFLPLQSLMNPNSAGGVELHCCRAAVEPFLLLEKMAQAFGVRVVAPLENQLGMSCWQEANLCSGRDGGGYDAVGRFEGPIVRVYPDGRIIQTTGTGETPPSEGGVSR